jgi:hypothetical protein
MVSRAEVLCQRLAGSEESAGAKESIARELRSRRELSELEVCSKTHSEVP